MATYYARHREEMLAKQKAYRETHHQEYIDYLKQYYQTTLKAKRNLERVHQPSRMQFPQLARTKRSRIRHQPKPKTPPLPRPPRVRKYDSHNSPRTPTEYTVHRRPGCVISWE